MHFSFADGISVYLIVTYNFFITYVTPNIMEMYRTANPGMTVRSRPWPLSQSGLERTVLFNLSLCLYYSIGGQTRL